jgi:hypothetical protein
MPTIDEIGLALQRAHEAGDTQGATLLAREYKRQQEAEQIRASVTDGMSGTEKFLGGMGKAFHDIGSGTGQLLREGIEAVSPQQQTISGLISGKKEPSLADRLGLPTRADVDENKRLEKPLMNTGAGIAGNITGNVALAAPLAFIPGANTVAGGATIGALTSALQPVGTEESRAGNMAIGGTTGAALPLAFKLGRTLKAGLIDPFTEAGRSGIAADLLNKTAADPQAVIAKLAQAKGATPGFMPTVGQAADDAGVATLERTIRAQYPQGFDAVDKSQRGALVDALRSIAKTPADRKAASDAVEEQAARLYGPALRENVEVTPTLSRLAGRPSLKKAESRALSLADESGMPFEARLKDMRPQSVAIPPRNAAPSSVIAPAEQFNPYSNVAPKAASEISIAGDRIPGDFMTIPPVESVPVRDMHTLKMGMDALLQDPTQGIAGREAAAIMATRNKLLDQLPESYQQARLGHIAINRPVNQMDIGTELYKKFVPALSDAADTPFSTRAASLAEALRSGDKLAQRATGLKNATLEGIMEPEQMALLQGVAKDSATKAAAESAGRGVGSDTVQKLSMRNLATKMGIPDGLANFAQAPAGWMKKAGNILYSDADEQIRQRLAGLLMDPQAAAAAMQKAGTPPSKIAEFLKKSMQAPMIAAPASANALQTLEQ